MNSVDPSKPSRSLIKLHSKDHEEILDVIDQLRSEGVSRYIGLPQLIVCGDQSSGKSSVLEAISGLDFPRKDNLCTRFATELILRRATEEAVTVSIIPDDSCSTDEKARLRNFKPHHSAPEHFADIIQSAGDWLGVGKDGVLFSKDILRVELQSPEQSHLTLVDLPGLYHAPDESQDEEGVAFVESLVSSYMNNPRSVILAVISAKSDIALQKVTALTRKVDPEGARTLGIITKPDTLPRGSETEQSFCQLAMNNRLRFKLGLGWHVLKNRSYEERDISLEERSRSENQFLSQGVWAALPRSQVGIESLRPRLSMVLRDHILSSLPGLIDEAQATLRHSGEHLLRLGQARQTLVDQRRFLLRSSERFSLLVSNAVNGVYYDPYFGDAMSQEGYEKRLRAVVQNRLTDFSDTMRSRGEFRKIIDDSETVEENDSHIRRSLYVSEVQRRMRRTRGCELPGTFSPLIIGELFYIHASPWQTITTSFVDSLIPDLRKAVTLILRGIVDDKSLEGLLRHVINPKFDELEASLRSKVDELLEPQRKGHPITYNHYFTDNVQKARDSHFRRSMKKKLRELFPSPIFNQSRQETHTFDIDELAGALATRTEADMEKFACSEATDCMVAYYKVREVNHGSSSSLTVLSPQVARKKFVDDFSNLAIERCFLEPLTMIFSSQVVDELPDRVIEEIAAEDESSRLERQRLEEKVAVLHSLLERLHRLDRHHLAGSTFQSNRTSHRLTLLTEVRNVEEQHFTNLVTKTEIESNSDTSSVQARSPGPAEDTIPADGDFHGSDVSKEVAEVDQAVFPEEALEDWNASPKKAKKKKHRSAGLWE